MSSASDPSSPDVLVAGGGIVGASAALELSEAGASVTLVDASTMTPAQGSSAGSIRIYVPAAYPDERYLHAGLRSLSRWREIAERRGRRLLDPVGVLSFGSFASEQLPALHDSGEAAERLDDASARDRFGIDLPGGVPVIFQPDAGVLLAEAAHETLLALLAEAGVAVSPGEGVREIRESGEGLEVETTDRVVRCGAVVLATGPWTGRLLEGLGIEHELEPTAQTVLHLEPTSPLPASLPALIDYEGEEPYALPEPDGRLKVAFHARGPEVDPAEGPPDPDPAVAERLKEWAERRLPGIAFAGEEAEVCVYTNTPDEQFVIERHGRVVVASACNGQGFQMAPDSGRRAATLALEALGSPSRVVRA